MEAGQVEAVAYWERLWSVGRYWQIIDEYCHEGGVSQHYLDGRLGFGVCSSAHEHIADGGDLEAIDEATRKAAEEVIGMVRAGHWGGC